MSAIAENVPALAASAAEWRVISLLLSRPRAGWHEELSALAAEVGDAVLRDGARAARGAGEGAYHALLGAGGRASAREAAYLGFGDPGRILADLAARYAAFGFDAGEEEPGDHLAVLCGFVSYMFLKEAYAAARGHDEHVLVTRAERTRLLAEHASAAGHGFAASLPDDAPAHLRAAAAALLARLPPPRNAPASSAHEDPLDAGCPMAGRCGRGAPGGRAWGTRGGVRRPSGQLRGT